MSSMVSPNVMPLSMASGSARAKPSSAFVRALKPAMPAPIAMPVNSDLPSDLADVATLPSPVSSLCRTGVS
jgi:hypothetical protein